MKSPENGFYSAENAESEGIEGKFYLWTSEEIDHILTDKENKIFKMAYGIKEEGNYLEEATRRSNGTNILYMERPIQEIASELANKVCVWDAEANRPKAWDEADAKTLALEGSYEVDSYNFV